MGVKEKLCAVGNIWATGSKQRICGASLGDERLREAESEH